MEVKKTGGCHSFLMHIGAVWSDNLPLLQKQVSPRKTKIAPRHFCLRNLAGRFCPEQDPPRQPKFAPWAFCCATSCWTFSRPGQDTPCDTIAFAICSQAILMGTSLPIPSNPHLQANARWFALLTAWPQAMKEQPCRPIEVSYRSSRLSRSSHKQHFKSFPYRPQKMPWGENETHPLCIEFKARLR